MTASPPKAKVASVTIAAGNQRLIADVLGKLWWPEAPINRSENQLTLGQMVHRRRFQTQPFYYHLFEHRTSLRAFQRKTQ